MLCDDDIDVCDERDYCVYADKEYIIPVFVNGVPTSGVRDTGFNGSLLISQELIKNEHVNYDQCMSLKGAFDGNCSREVPTTVVRFRSPHFLHDKDVKVTAGVLKLPPSVYCLIGNQIFKQYPELKDVVTLRPDCVEQTSEPSVNRQTETDVALTNDGQGQPCDLINIGNRTGELLAGRSDEDSYNQQDSRVISTAPTECTNTRLTDDTTESRTPDAAAPSTEIHTGDNEIDRAGQTVHALGDADTNCQTVQALDLTEPDSSDKTNNAMDICAVNAVTRSAASKTTVFDAQLRKQTIDGRPGQNANTASEVTRNRASEAIYAGSKVDHQRRDDLSGGALSAENRQTANDCDRPTDELRRAFAEMTAIDVNDNVNPLPDGTSEFAAEQSADPSLKHLWVKANNGSNELKIGNGLLFKRVPNSVVTPDFDFALVIPTKYQQEIIRTAHKGMISAHSGVANTEKRISALFYFPKMRYKIKQYVKSCHECQMTSHSKVKDRVPLQHLQINANHAFEDITMDIVGELPTTQRKNKFILMIVCNVTKFVHAIPLSNLRAENIADKLIELFSWVGIPRVIRSDQMPSFKSEVMDAVKKKLGIQSQYAAIYHHISVGGVERVNATIENALRKFLLQHGNQWDKWLTYILFAMREIPHTATGYSAAELLYGFKFRGLLHVMRETWTGQQSAIKYRNKSTATYLEDLTKPIDSALKAAKENNDASQQRMKENYDKRTTNRELQVGQQVLILLPTCTNKLLFAWRGPATVINKCGNGNYEVQMDNRFHINQLKRYYTQGETEPTTGLMVINDRAGDDLTQLTADWAECDKEGEASPAQTITIGEQLTADQHDRLQRLLAAYDDVLTDRIGRTHLIQHEIVLTDDTPVYQASYKMPETLKTEVKNEIDRMLADGILQVDDNTCWNNPLIVIRKQGGGVRLCHNFIPLNSKTVNQPYPMQDVKNILNKVAGAFITTRIDLKKSYWQLPLAPESQQYTGFWTPWGFYSYTVCPMESNVRDSHVKDCWKG